MTNIFIFSQHDMLSRVCSASTLSFMVHLSDALYFTVGDSAPRTWGGVGESGEEVKLLQGKEWTGLFLEKVPNPHYGLTMWLAEKGKCVCLWRKYGALERKQDWKLQGLPWTSSVIKHMIFRHGCFDTDCWLGNIETWPQKQNSKLSALKNP